MSFARVKAVQAGQYAGIWRDIGDVFDIANSTDFSDSSVSQVPVGNPDYPLYGWMLKVPGATPLYSYAATSGGNSYATLSTYGHDSANQTVWSIPRYVQ